MFQVAHLPSLYPRCAMSTTTTTTAHARYLTDNELADKYNVSRVTIWRWTRAGNLPAPIKLAENCTRWRESDVLAWEAEKAAQVSA